MDNLNNHLVGLVLKRVDNVIGIILFGSSARGEIDQFSDVDLAVVVSNKDYDPKRRKIVLESVKPIEIWFYPENLFTKTFESNEFRSREDTWYRTSFWVEMLREGKILYDPLNRLTQWRSKALKWRWYRSEVKSLMERSFKNLQVSFQCYDPIECLIALRDTVYTILIAYLMLKQKIPSVRPGDLYKKCKGTIVGEVFEEVQRPCNFSDIPYYLLELGLFVEKYWLQPGGAKTELKNAFKNFYRGRMLESLLYSRYSAFFVGVSLLRLLGYNYRVRLYDALDHLTMVKLLRGSDYYHFYRKLHSSLVNVYKYSIKVSSILNLLESRLETFLS